MGSRWCPAWEGMGVVLAESCCGCKTTRVGLGSPGYGSRVARSARPSSREQGSRGAVVAWISALARSARPTCKCFDAFDHSNRTFSSCLVCFSKFGDVVYTLTRFFRDGGTRGPTKLQLARNDYQVSESQLLGKFHLNKPLVPQAVSKPMAKIGEGVEQWLNLLRGNGRFSGLLINSFKDLIYNSYSINVMVLLKSYLPRVILRIH